MVVGDDMAPVASTEVTIEATASLTAVTTYSSTPLMGDTPASTAAPTRLMMRDAMPAAPDVAGDTTPATTATGR